MSNVHVCHLFRSEIKWFIVTGSTYVSNGSCFCCRTLIWMKTCWKIKSSVCGFILFWGPDSSCDLWNYFHWEQPVTNKTSPCVRLSYFTETAPHPLLRGRGSEWTCPLSRFHLLLLYCYMDIFCQLMEESQDGGFVILRMKGHSTMKYCDLLNYGVLFKV